MPLPLPDNLPSPETRLATREDPPPPVPPVPPVPAAVVATSGPARQLGEMPHDELEALAEEIGLDPTRYKLPQDLVAAVHRRRQLIGSFDRDALLDLIRWGRRPVAANAAKEQLAIEVLRMRSMRFSGLSERGLRVLAALRGCEISSADDVPDIVRKLRRQEGFFARMNRKRRGLVGSLLGKIVGETKHEGAYKFLPPQPGQTSAHEPPRRSSLKEDIEEAGIIGGLTSRLKRSADSYLNQKLDEIEARIDRKLDEIDRRLGEWRDKEVANRIRILKITLWVSVIVALVSLVYMYIRVVVAK